MKTIISMILKILILIIKNKYHSLIIIIILLLFKIKRLKIYQNGNKNNKMKYIIYVNLKISKKNKKKDN
jgi:hypothetical protein